MFYCSLLKQWWGFVRALWFSLSAACSQQIRCRLKMGLDFGTFLGMRVWFIDRQCNFNQPQQVFNMGKQVKVEPTTQPPRSHKKSKIKVKPPIKLEQPLQVKQQPSDTHNPPPKPTPKKKKHRRIILRNLIVDANEKHLRKLCSPFGEIVEVSIPKHGVKNCGRGFAFIEFTSKNMCLKAIKALNQTLFKGRTIVADMAVSKEEFKRAEGENTVGKEEEGDGKVVTTKMEVEEEEVKEVQEEDKAKEIKFEQKPKGQEDLSSTVFVRNVPMSTTQDDLYKFFRKYGKIKFAKLVVDKQTQQPKGTAFVKFRQSDPAQKLIKYSRQYQQSMNSKFAQKFEMNPDINLQIEGRIVKIFPAESKTSLHERLQDRQKKEKDKDPKKKVKPLKKVKHLDELITFDKHHKRNLELAIEGIYRGQTWMHPVDKDKFENHYKDKVEKLKNPNNFVSTTRIILKYLDRSITEQDLKTICFNYLDSISQKHKMLNYCKLMLDESRTKSIGIAFVEFVKPETSLGFLRWIKQNRQTIFQQRQAILSQFVIQDARKISVIKKKIKKVK